MSSSLISRIFNIKDPEEFRLLAADVYKYQLANNKIYREYVSRLGINVHSKEPAENIPFLPVGFFRNHMIITGNETAEVVFESSGTTGPETSRHYVTDLLLYEKSFTEGFRKFYGEPADYFIGALLPSYIERGNSSLIYMADSLIKKSRDRRSGFYIGSDQKLINTLREVTGEKKKAMLIGVSFALMDLAEKFSTDLSGVTVVETGGMKGRRKEVTREELHDFLRKRFNIKKVHSEYGMTELLSQAWSAGDGLFYTPPWMKITLRELYDPLSGIREPGITGGINIIDLANVNSCSFIATNDLGRLHEDGGFEVLGRFDNSDTRGCNLLIE